jgi:glucose/arabinose dehydrogenase
MTMIPQSIATASCRYIVCITLTVGVAFLCPSANSAAPFTIQGPSVNSNNFRITTFATGLDFPLGMAKLSDGSILVAVSHGEDFFNSTGTVIRLTDTNNVGIADGPGTALYTNLPGSLTDVRVAGSLVLVAGLGKPITILRAGASPSAPLTLVGQIIFNYPDPAWEHVNSSLGIRKTLGQTNSYDLLFQVGSESNFAVTVNTAILTNNNIPGANATLLGDSLYMLTITDNGTNVVVSNITRLANGLRNPAGVAFNPATGDLYLQDNGIDGLVNANLPLSADELNFIARTNVAVVTEFFGFPTNYTAYRTGTMVGGLGVQPLFAFQPTPDPFTGHESTGANNLLFAPTGFPDGLNSGIFIGFHGQLYFGGTNNLKNPVIYADPVSGTYFHFIEGSQPGIGHLDGLMTTRDSLFLADLVSNGNLGNGTGAGVIYQIKSLVSPTPPPLGLQPLGSQLMLTWGRGALQTADEMTGTWSDVTDAFSPYTTATTAVSHKFYRLRY